MIAKLCSMLGLDSEEFYDVLKIITNYTIAETALDVVGSLDPTFVASLGAEGIEID